MIYAHTHIHTHTHIFNIVIFQDTCEPICFKLGVMLNTTKLQFDCSLIDHHVHSRS